MENEQILTAFFKLENLRDWDKYQSYLHPQIEWTLFSLDGQRLFSGIAAYMKKIKAAYGDSDVTFCCKEMIVSSNGNRIATVLENAYGEVSVDVFEFENGLIIREFEYLMS